MPKYIKENHRHRWWWNTQTCRKKSSALII